MRRAALFLALVLPGARAPAADLVPAEIYRQTLRGTAWVITPAKGKGTGWLFDGGRRLLVTNHHVVAGHDTVDVVFPTDRDGRLVTDRTFYLHNVKQLRRSGGAVGGRVLRTDRDRDLALVELDAVPDSVEALKLAAKRPGPGEEVYSVGNRGDLDVLWTYTAGWVRQDGRT
jgi:S1-C subfamily serine protease